MTPDDIRLSIIIATMGRPSLLTALGSVYREAREGDECLAVLDTPAHGGWGYVAHNRGLDAATGTHLIFIGDDDDFLEGAFGVVRAAVAAAPDRVHLFRVARSPGHFMPTAELSGREFTRDLIPQGGIVVPRIGGWPLPRWEARHDADRKYAAQACENSRMEPVWHREVIGRWRVANWPGWEPVTLQPEYTKTQQNSLAGIAS